MKNLLFVLAFLSSFSCFGGHIVGGTISYEARQGTSNTYDFSVDLFHDPIGGATLDWPAYFSIYEKNGSTWDYFDAVFVNEMEIISVLGQHPCTDVFLVASEVGNYQFEYTFPDNQKDYVVVYQRCCYSSEITNLMAADNFGQSIVVELTAAARAVKNNAPKLEENTVFLTCKGVQTDFNFSLTDADGDSLVYSFYAPFRGGGLNLSDSCAVPRPNVPCAPPYAPVTYYGDSNAEAPFGLATATDLDINTGICSVTISEVGIYLVGVIIEEFRNGEALGSTYYNFMVYVADVVSDDEVKKEPQLSIYPNPATNSIRVKSDLNQSLEGDLVFINSYGQEVVRTNQRLDANQEINIQNLPAGLYTLVFRGEREMIGLGIFVKE